MTPEELDAIEARAAAAHPGPWERSHWMGEDDSRVESADGRMTIYDEGGHSVADAEFIAHARQDIPALLAEVRRLQVFEPVAQPERMRLQAVQDALAEGQA